MSDVYEDALRKLVKDDMVSAAAVKRITGLDLDASTEEITKAVGLLHTMLCENCGVGCTFIQEEQWDKPWDRASHMIWLQKAHDIADEYQLDDKALLNAVTAATSGLQSVSTFCEPALHILMKFIRVHLRQAQKVATVPAPTDDQASGLEEGFADQGLD